MGMEKDMAQKYCDELNRFEPYPNKSRRRVERSDRGGYLVEWRDRATWAVGWHESAEACESELKYLSGYRWDCRLERWVLKAEPAKRNE